MKHIRIFLMVWIAVLALASEGFTADPYPSRPIRLVVPFGPGGGSDIFARNIARIMQEDKILPVAFNVINLPGGSGVTGYNDVARRKGDPYSLATVSASFWTTPLLGLSPISYRDFTPVAGLGFDTFMLVTRTQNPFRNLQELIAAAKSSPGKITVSVPAIAADDSVVTNMLERAAGIKLNPITFGGSGPALLAALGGHADVTWSNPAEILPHVEAKRLRVLAVSSPKRLPQFPDVPTLRELGFDVVFSMFRGLVMPAGVSAEAHKIISDAVMRLCKGERWQKEFIEKSMIAGVCMNPEEFAQAIRETNELYSRVFAELGLLKKK